MAPVRRLPVRPLLPAAQLARSFRGAANRYALPAVSVLGPRFSGKSECLQDAGALLAKRKADPTSALPILVDLETLGHGPDEELTERLVVRLLGHHGLAPEHLRAPEDGGCLTQCLKTLGAFNTRGTVVFIDHLDAVPASFARHVVRSFRIAFDKRAVVPEYCRIGVVFAGSTSLSLLRRSGESAFITQFVTMPSIEPAARIAGVHRYWPRPLPDHVAAYVASVTGGERPFLELLADVLERCPAVPTAADIDLAIRQICRTSSSDILRQLTLVLLLDSELYGLANEVLQHGDGRVARRDLAPDIDLFSLSGALVLVPNGGFSTNYAFRNTIVRRFIERLIEWRGNPEETAIPPALATIAQELDTVARSFASAPRIWTAAQLLGQVWALLTGSRDRPDDIYIRLEPHGPSARGCWVSSQAGAVGTEDQPFNIPPATQAAVRGVIETHEGLPCVAFDDLRMSVAAATTTGYGRLTVAIVLTRRDVVRLREHTLQLWQRALEAWSNPIALASLAEVGYQCVLRGHRPESAAARQCAAAADSETQPARPGLQPDTLRQLVARLAEVGYQTGKQAADFVIDFLDRSEIPELWKRELSGHAQGSFDDAMWYVVRLLVQKGTMPACGCSALAAVLAANAESFGVEDRLLFRRVIDELRNPADSRLFESFTVAGA